MQYQVIAIFTGLILSVTANASEQYICELDNQQRIIEVIYKNPLESVPCQVNYRKKNSSETLWQAKNQAGYCEAKADEFAIKLESLGWRCQHLDQPAADSKDNQASEVQEIK
ncbi:hypothetical protein [Shewanella violacea]|uniref:Orphan protein n=1 Tax=Shewanella violacea (strain JCM 10179 / CIP 106290 / LMG 19151 / DSS12) TaxID=637905 RepID=D4ZC74_SHEVD|nr:hypothetical protein [Shewanella violacea]BAJ03619.1 conserved hypothetical protein [Shewanella violacea DSS12]